MKSWFLAFAAVAVAAYFLINPFRTVAMPRLLRGGTEQIIAQWKDAMLAYKADEGEFPPVDPEMEPTDSYIFHLTGENKLKKEYLDRNSVRIHIFVPKDGWDRPLIFDPEKKGDLSRIVSMGEDGIHGTPDDIDSLNVKQRHIPVPADLVDERAARRKAEAKAKAGVLPAAPAGTTETPKPAPKP